MKIAVVLTGHMRCWEAAYPSIKNLFLDRYDTGVFISTWNNLGFWTSPEHDPENKGINGQSPDLDVQSVIEAYRPKAISVHDQKEMISLFDRMVEQYELDKISIQIRPRNIVSQFWIQKMGLELLYSGYHMHYDYVIRLRPDLVFLGDLPIFDLDKTYVLNHPNHEGHGVGDMFLASNCQHMHSYLHYLQNNEYIDVARKTSRFCPHILTERFIESAKPVILNVAKTLAHTPNGQYKDWKPS